MRAIIVTAFAMIVAIALITALITLNYPINAYPSEELGKPHTRLTTQQPPTPVNVTVAGTVERANEVLREVVVNGVTVNLAGTWKCSNMGSPISGGELTRMLKPGVRVVITAEKGYVGLNAVTVLMQGSGTYCTLIQG